MSDKVYLCTAGLQRPQGGGPEHTEWPLPQGLFAPVLAFTVILMLNNKQPQIPVA